MKNTQMILERGLTSLDDVNTARKLQADLHRAQKEREPIFEQFKAPIRYLASHVDEKNRVGRDAIEAGKKALGRAIGTWEDEQERKAELERKRIEEEQRAKAKADAEREARAKEKEAKRVAALAKKTGQTRDEKAAARAEARELEDQAADIRNAEPVTPVVNVQANLGSTGGRRRSKTWHWRLIGTSDNDRRQSKFELLKAIVEGKVSIDAVDISDTHMKAKAKSEGDNMNAVHPATGERMYPGIEVYSESMSGVTGR